MTSLFKKIAIIATFIFVPAVIATLVFSLLRDWGIYDVKPIFQTFQEIAISSGFIAFGTGLAALTLTKIEQKK